MGVRKAQNWTAVEACFPGDLRKIVVSGQVQVSLSTEQPEFSVVSADSSAGVLTLSVQLTATGFGVEVRRWKYAIHEVDVVGSEYGTVILQGIDGGDVTIDVTRAG